MGDYTYPKPKVGYSIAHAKQTSSKLLSIFLAIIMVSTVFSSIVIADDQGTDPVGDNADDFGKGADTTQSGKIGSRIKDLIDRIRENRKGLLSLSVVTRYQKDESSEIKETSTRMRLILPTGIDIDGDGYKDVRVWILRHPALDLSPPALAWKTTILVRRLPGMDETMVNGFFEIYMEYKPRVASSASKLISKLLPAETNSFIDRIRIGYQSPAGEEIPKYCMVSHKDIPHVIYPRQKNAHEVSINPGVSSGKDKLNLLFSIADMEGDTVKSELNLQINCSPAVKSEFSIERSKDNFIRRGQTLEISRNNVNSNVSLYIKDIGPLDRGSLTVESLPKKITLGWKLARTGYVSISTEGSKTGAVEAKVDGVIDIGFTPETSLKGSIDWSIPSIIGHLRGKRFNLAFSTDSSIILDDLYVSAPLFKISEDATTDPVVIRDFALTASRLSVYAKASVNVSNFILSPGLHMDTISGEVNNADVVLENCNINVEITTDERPTVKIESLEDGETVSGIVNIKGTASAPDDKIIDFVQIKIDDGDWIEVGNEDWSYLWDTRALFNGDHKIIAQSFDGEYFSSPLIISVTTDNTGNNWYPLISIETPQDGDIVSGVVQITGTATDPFGSISKVEIKINKGDWIEADAFDSATGDWSYEWNTEPLPAGKYTIKARSYDGTIYSSIASITVSIKGAPLVDVIGFTLEDASIIITNFAVNGLLPIMDITGIEVSSFNASGSGSLNVTKDSIYVEVGGSLNIDNVSISAVESDVPIRLLDNLTVNAEGYGVLFLTKSVIHFELDASVFISADDAFGIKNFIFGLNGEISATLSVDESGVVALGGDVYDDHFLMDITDLLVEIEGIISMGADQIAVHGTGNISVVDEQLKIEGALSNCVIDGLYINISSVVVSFSGNIDYVRNGALNVEFSDLFNFNISYNGENDLNITDVGISIRSSSGNMSAYADSVIVKSGGCADFSYYKNDAKAEVFVSISAIYLTGLSLHFDGSSYGPVDIGWYGYFHFVLSADITIEQGEDWIRITIGGGGNAHIDIHTTLNFNGTDGPISVVMDLLTGDDVFVIYLYNLSGNVGFDIDGSASVNVEELDLVISGIINISIERLYAGFDVNASGENGGFLSLDIKDSGFALEEGHFAIDISDSFSFLLAGNIDVSLSGNTSGTIEATFNESGIIGLSVDFDANVMVDITYLSLIYDNVGSSTSVDLTSDQIVIGGSGYLIIALDHISAGITTSGDMDQEVSDYEGIVLKNFLLNATNLLSSINVIAEIESLQISGSLFIDYSNDITFDTSSYLAGQNISLALNLPSIETYVSAKIGLFEISGEGGGMVTIVDKNISLTSSHDADIIVEGLFVDIVYPDEPLLLILEEADISFTGVDAVISVDISDGATINADLSGDAHIAINTLWAYIADMDLRLRSVYLDGPTTITANVEEDALVTINTEDTIYAGEVTISGFFNLYGLEGGPEVSIGMAPLGDFIIGISGSWHIDIILVFGKLIQDVTFEGEIEHMSLGFGGTGGPVGFDWLRVQGHVKESSTISLNGFKAILESGEFVVSIDGLSTLESTTDSINIGALFYLESPGKIQLGLIFDNFTIAEGKGYLELNMNLNSLDNPEEIDTEIDGKWNGEFGLLGRRINITGEGEGNFALEAGGSLQNGDLYGSLQLDMEGTTYWTIFPANVLPNPLLGIRFAVDREAHIDFDFGPHPDTGDLVIETNEETIIINQEGETIVMNENGEIIYQNTQGNRGNSLPDGEELELFNGDFYFWIWNPITKEWFPSWIEGPDLDGSVTLLVSKAGSNNVIKVNSLEILPGDKVVFTACYIPAEGSGEGAGHYNFVFDYGDGSDPLAIPVDYSDGLIIVHPDNHMYTELDNCTVSVTVIDTADPDEAVADTIPIYVVDKYLGISDSVTRWDYEDVADDGKLYGSFKVRNLANKTYSNNYILNWSIEADFDNMKWGTEWVFEPTSGSIEAENSTVVTFSFKPEEEKRDYKGANITVINDDKPEENKTLYFNVWYGLVDLLPDATKQKPINLIIEKGEVKTFENVFWVYSNRWEKLEWNVSIVDLPGNLTVDCIPKSGTMYPGDPPAAVALEIDASDGGKGDIKIKAQRVGDPADNDTIHVFVNTITGGGSGGSSDWLTLDGHINNKWRGEWRAIDNELNTVAYYNKAHSGWTQDYLTLTLDSPTSCSGFRINAKSGDHLDKLEVKLYNNNVEQFSKTFNDGEWNNYQWTECDFGTSKTVDKVEIRYHLESGYTYGSTVDDIDPHWGIIREFNFKEAT